MKLTPMCKFSVENLIGDVSRSVDYLWNRVFQMRRSMRKWMRTLGVEVSVARFMDTDRDVIAGHGDPYMSPQISPVL